MDKLLFRVKYSDGSRNVLLWDSRVIKSLLFIFLTTQELTNWQSFCSKFTFLRISFTTSYSATKKLTFGYCFLANDKQSFLSCFHQHWLEKCTIKTTTTTAKTNPTCETSFPPTRTVISCRKRGPMCLY